MGAPGILLALLLWLTMKEPTRLNAELEAPPLIAVMKRISRSRSFVAFTLGSGMVALVGFGLNLFLIPLLVRRFGFDLREAALTFALTFSAATALGGVAGGILADRFAASDYRRYGSAPMLATSLALPLYLAAIYQDDWRIMAVLLFAATFCLYAFLPTIMTVTQRLVEPRMRATAAAIHAFGQTVFGLGVGSAFLGLMSDRLAAWHYGGSYKADCIIAMRDAGLACRTASATGLQQAMLLLGLFLLLAIGAYWVASRAIAAEIVALES
jgi:MFS family permease